METAVTSPESACAEGSSLDPRRRGYTVAEDPASGAGARLPRFVLTRCGLIWRASEGTWELEVSIFRAGPGSGWAEKILPMTIPLDAAGLNFRVGLGLGPGLGGLPTHFIV
jgi:hypothetical protein